MSNLRGHFVRGPAPDSLLGQWLSLPYNEGKTEKDFEEAMKGGGGSTQAVEDALASSEMAQLVAQTRTARLEEEAASKWAVALETRVYWLEDAFEPEERQKILSGYYHDHSVEGVNHAVKLQALFDLIPDGSVVRARAGSVFQVDKCTGYRPDIFGEKGRQVTQRGATLTVDGAQPCVTILNKRRLYLDFEGAEFICQKLGQTIFYLMGDGVDDEGNPKSGGHYWRHTGKLRTRPYLQIGYKGGRKGLFVPMDGWTEEAPWLASGYANKGYHTLGMNSTDYAVDVSRFDNNSARCDLLTEPANLDMSNSSNWILSLGGYRNTETGKHEFPQDDGSVSETWGIWRGMQIGSVGNAILITGDDNTTVRFFDAAGFHGSAIQYGKGQDCKGDDVGRGDVVGAKARGLVASRQVILGGQAKHNYTGVIQLIRVWKINISGIDCDGVVGHPDWSLEHSRDGKGTTIDPGYGLAIGRSLPVYGIVAEWNNWGTCARKCMDAHCGSHIVYRHNFGYAGYYGISMVVQESLAVEHGKETEDPTTHKYRDSVMELSHNTFYVGHTGLHMNNGSFGMNERLKNKSGIAAYPLWFLEGSFHIHHNNIYAPNGFSYNYGHSGNKIEHNLFVFALPFGEYYGLRPLRGAVIEEKGSGYKVGDKVVPAPGQGGSYKSRDAEWKVTTVDAQGGITQVDQVVGGTHYYKNVATVIASEQGVGAKITLTPRAESYAASLGAINGRGESYGDTFSFNHFRNSMDGNFTYGVVLGDVVAGTVFGNRFDVTPYYTVELGERESKPYASRRAFRSGSPSVPIIQSGGQVTYSYWENNMWFNKATGQAALVPSPANNGTSWGTTRPADAARSLLVPIPRKPDAPEPRPFKTPPVSSEATEIVFDFTGDYDGIFWDKRGEYMIQPWVPVERFRPSDWAYVDVSAEPPLMKTRHVTGFVGGCTRIYMDLSEGQDRKSTLVLPFKALSKSLTTRLVGTVGCEVAVVNSTAKPGTHFRVTIPSGAEMYIDGEPVTTTTDYPYDTNHKLAIRGNFQQDSLVFGAQAANGNNVGSFDYGAFTFYKYTEKTGEELRKASVVA